MATATRKNTRTTAATVTTVPEGLSKGDPKPPAPKPAPKPPIITDEIQSYLGTYMAFADEDQPLIVALWVLHTWTFSEMFPRMPYTTPYLYVHSAQKQSGKTLLIDLLESITLNPERTVDMTSSVLFRLIESVHPTLFIDEVDAVWSGAKNEALRGVLNGGYKHGGYVWRTEGGTPSKFGTFSPKLLAGIDNGFMPDTVMDRCIPIKLARKRAEDKREIYYAMDAGPMAETLTEQIEEWVFGHASKVIDYRPKPIPDVPPRAFEISFPLLQIAHALGIEPAARAALSRLLAPTKSMDTPEVATLRAIGELFERTGSVKLHTEQILEVLDGMSAKRLSGMLRPFGITGGNTLSINGRMAKGYWRHQFEEAWDRYL